jgi:hypothetical protein
MTPHKPSQLYLISPAGFFGSNPLRKYELLFETLESPATLAAFLKRQGAGAPSVPLFKKLIDHFNFEIHAVMDNAAYHSGDSLKFVIHDLHALLRISSTEVGIYIVCFEMTCWRMPYDPRRIIEISSAQSPIPNFRFSYTYIIFKIIDLNCQENNAVDPKKWLERPKNG